MFLISNYLNISIAIFLKLVASFAVFIGKQIINSYSIDISESFYKRQ